MLMRSEYEPPEKPASVEAQALSLAPTLPRLFLVIVIPASVIVGLGLGWLTSTLDRGNRVVVGNTGKTLSMVVRSDDTFVVIGGGTSRTDLADLIDRSTLPWRRRISLLIIGTNSDQAMGAMSLLQRNGVDTVVVAGIPESEPIWDEIDRQAAQHHIPVKYLDRPTRIRITSSLTIDAVPIEATTGKGSTGTLVRLRAGHLRFAWVAGISKNSKLTAGDPMYDLRSNLFVNADGGVTPSQATGAILSITPAAARAASLRAITSRFAAILDTGERLPIRYSGDELRMPHDRVIDQNNESTQ